MVSEDGGLLTVVGKLDVPLPMSAVMAIVRDYAGCARIFRNIEACSVEPTEHGLVMYQARLCGCWQVVGARVLFRLISKT
jgi:hypothetical protein